MRREGVLITCCRQALPPPGGVADGSESLLAAIADRRDDGAFTRLFSIFAPRIERYLRRLGAEQALAEDLTQEVMLVLWQRAGQYDRARATPSSWIFTIARNRFVDARRRRRWEVMGDVSAIAGAADDDTEHSFYLTQLERHLRHAVATLPREQNRLIEQGYLLDKSQTALADEFDLPLGTVKSRQRLAFDRLRRQLVGLR